MARVPLFIDPKSLNTQVSTVTLARGGELYRSLAVLDYEVDVVGDGKLTLEGEVQGSLPDPYWVKVSCTPLPTGSSPTSTATAPAPWARTANTRLR